MKSLHSNGSVLGSWSITTLLAAMVMTASIPLQAAPQNDDSFTSSHIGTIATPPTSASSVHDVTTVNQLKPAAITEPQGVLELEQAIALAIQYQSLNSLQSLWQARQQIAVANLQHSQRWKNPELSIEQTGLRRNDERELALSVSQQLDLFGLRPARQKLATIALETESIRQLAYQSQLKLAVTAAYWRVAQAEWAVALEQDQRNLSANSEQVAKRRLSAGRIAEVDYSRVLMAHQQAMTQLTAAQAVLTEARFQLSRLWGNTQPVFQATQSSLNPASGWPTLDRAQISAGLNDNLQQTLLGQQQSQAEAALRLAQAQAKPQPTLTLGINQIKPPVLQMGTERRLTLGVSLPIPIFQRNQAVIAATRALGVIAHAQQDYSVSKRHEQAQAVWIRLDALSSQYQQLQQQQLPLAKSIQHKTLLGFEAGKFSVTEVQQATRDYQAVQFNQLQLLSQAWQLALQLQALSLGLEADFEANNANYLDNSQRQLWQDSASMPINGAGE